MEINLLTPTAAVLAYGYYSLKRQESEGLRRAGARPRHSSLPRYRPRALESAGITRFFAFSVFSEFSAYPRLLHRR